MIAYSSRTVQPAETRYGITALECLALIYGIKTYRPYLLGKTFIANTDHKALIYLSKFKDINHRVTGWALKLSEYDFIIRYRKGASIPHADALSRYPVDETEETTEEVSTEQIGTITQLVLPQPLREEILVQFHDKQIAGHLGVGKTYKRIRTRFWWPNMKDDIAYYVKSCLVCSSINTPLNRQLGSLQPTEVPLKAAETMSMDILGPLRRTRRGNRYILVMVDFLTKWVELVVLGDQTAESITTAFCQRMVL